MNFLQEIAFRGKEQDPGGKEHDPGGKDQDPGGKEHDKQDTGRKERG